MYDRAFRKVIWKIIIYALYSCVSLIKHAFIFESFYMFYALPLKLKWKDKLKHRIGLLYFMVYFMCMGLVELRGTQSKRELRKKNITTQSVASPPAHPTFVNDAYRWPWPLTCHLQNQLSSSLTMVNMPAKLSLYMYSVHNLISIHLQVNCELDLWPLTCKINRVHPLTVANMSAKFDEKKTQRFSLYHVHKLITICLLWPWPLTSVLQNQ